MLSDGVQAVRAALLADSLLVNGNGSDIAGIGTKLHWGMVSKESDGSIAYPFGLMSFNSGGSISTYKTEMANLYLLVKVVALNDPEQAAYLGNRIYEALHEAQLSNIGSWQVWRCQMQGKVHYPVIDAEIRTWHDGGIFRLRMSV